MHKLEGRWLTLTLLDDMNLQLELTPEGRERVDEIKAWGELPFVYPDKKDNEHPHEYFERCARAKTEWDFSKDKPNSMNDHQILRELLDDFVLSDDLTWEYGNTVAMHGSFLIIGHWNGLASQVESFGDDATYWYDNFYAVRNIIKDLTYNFDSKGKKMSVLLREPKPVVLWLGPTNE